MRVVEEKRLSSFKFCGSTGEKSSEILTFGGRGFCSSPSGEGCEEIGSADGSVAVAGLDAGAGDDERDTNTAFTDCAFSCVEGVVILAAPVSLGAIVRHEDEVGVVGDTELFDGGLNSEQAGIEVPGHTRVGRVIVKFASG